MPITTGVRWTVQVANRKATALKLEQPAGGTASTQLRLTGFDFYPDGNRGAVC